MAYQIEKTYTSFGGGISDDDFLGSSNSVQDLDGIDVQTQERYTQAEGYYTQVASYTLSGGAGWVKETPYSLFISNFSTVQRNGVTISLPASAYAIESYGTSTDQVNYFFLGDRLRRMNSDGSAQIGTDITTNYPGYSSALTPPILGWHVTNLLFSKNDKIYFVDTINNAITVTTSTATQLMPGSSVKCIYSYSYDSTVVIATNNGNTQIYELEFTGGAYSIARKIEIVGYECISAVGNGFDVFWKSYEGIHQYQGGQSVFIKKLEGITDSMAFNKQLLLATQNDLYTFGAKKPGRNNILTRTSKISGTSLTLITKNFMIVNVSGGYNILQKSSSAYKRKNTIRLLALDGGIYQIPKQDLNFRFGYIFDRDEYVDTTSPVRQEIVVKIKTDAMNLPIEVARVTDGDTLDSLGNARYGYMEITPNMVVTAFTTAGITTEFGYVEVTIELLAGDEYSTALGLYRKTPKLFDFTSRANFVKNV